MRLFKRIAAAVIAAALCVSLAACGGGFEGVVKTLVQGNLDEIYLGQFNSDYMKLVNSDEADCEESYRTGLETEAEFFINYFEIEYPTDELVEEIVELYKQIYSHSKYTVNDPAKLDDNTYAVKVQISPIDIVQIVSDNWDEGMEPLYEKYADVDTNSMSEEEYVQFDADWAEAIINMFYDQLPNLGYMDEQSIAVQITKGSDGIWMIADNDLMAVDAAILYYP